MDNRSKIFLDLKNILSNYAGTLVESGNNVSSYHLHGTKPARVGKSDYEGIYFASAVIRKKYVALHFFPIYTHITAFENIDVALRKCLKGKSCFHIKKDQEELYNKIVEMLNLGINVYKEEGWI
jgi:hypothetical protein